MTIASVASVPATPLLIPEVAAGAAGELEGLRSDCLAVLAEAGGGAQRAVVVSRGRRTRTLPASGLATLRGLGVHLAVDLAARDREGALVEDDWPVPDDAASLGTAVGSWLLSAAGWAGERVYVEVDGDVARAADAIQDAAEGAATMVVAVADGSAGRTDKAPASLVPGAVEFDDRLLAALREADLTWLVDPARGPEAESMACTGIPVWATVATALAGRDVRAGRVSFADPYGVGYPVATWTVA